MSSPSTRGSIHGAAGLLAALLSLPAVSLPIPSIAEDWPQWRGPDRTGISKETGLLKSWPKEGPPLAWRATGLGEGYSSVSVAGGRIYTMGNRAGKEMVIALDAAGEGKEVWAAEVGPARRVDYPGPRCTPTVDGDQLFALGVDGDLVCLEAGTGQERWRKSLRKDFRGGKPGWGYSESPLIDGERVVVTPGGKEATLVALKKESGEPIWKASVPRGKRETAHEIKADQGDGAQYSSVIKIDMGGVPQYVQFFETGVAGVSAGDGKFLWRYNKSANGTANISTPIYADGHVFTASGYGVGGGLVRLSSEGNAMKAREVYFTNKMKNHHGGVVLVKDHLYGFDEDVLRCIAFKSGHLVWHNRSVGKGSVAYADGHLYARSEDGPVALIEATPAGYREKGRFEQPDRSGKPAWPHPVISAGRLYLRDQDLLLCYDVRDRGGSAAGGSSSK